MNNLKSIVEEEATINVQVNPKCYNFLRNCKTRKCHLYGSAGSGKSWSVAQYLVIELMLKMSDIRIVVTRKTGPALTKSAWLLIQDLLKTYEIPYQKNSTERLITIGSNEMYFVALDDPEKLKSFEKINYVWAEEATELYYEDYVQLGLRCRGHNPHGQNLLIFSYNPVMKPYNGYLKKITDNCPEGCSVLHTTYKDNAFLDKEYVAEIERLREEDETYWTIYGLGKWAAVQNVIYTNWDIIQPDDWPKDIRNVGYGLDFGYNAPSALVQIGLKEFETWEKELIYERKLTNTQLIQRLEEEIPRHLRGRIIVADCAEPDRIEEIQQAGFNIWPCSKGPHSVRIGIDRCKRITAHIHSKSINLIDEIEVYKWSEDATGKALDKPVDYHNHLMDARRYYLGEIRFDGASEIIIAGDYC